MARRWNWASIGEDSSVGPGEDGRLDVGATKTAIGSPDRLIAEEAVNSRRNFLRTMGLGGAAAVVGAGGLSLLDAAPAFAGTTGVYWDQGGAVFNVMAYGATGNGTTDDTTAVTNAISAAQTAGGGVVYFPKGTFLISSTLTITADGVSLIGAGMGASTILAKSTFTSGDIIHLAQVKFARVQDIKISSASARTSGAAINAEGYPGLLNQDITVATYPVIQNVWLDNVYNGIYVNGNQNTFLYYIDRVYITTIATAGVGIWINTLDASESCFVSNCFINGGHLNDHQNRPLAAVRVQATGDFTLRSISVIECNNGLLIDPPSTQTIASGFIEGCLWDTCNQGVTINVTAGGVSKVAALTFVDNWIDYCDANGISIVGNAFHLTFAGCRMVNNGTNGFYANGGGAQRMFFTGCDVSGNDRNGVGSAGFYFANSTGQFVINGCNVDGIWTWDSGHTQAYGIRILSSCDYYVLTNNIVMNNNTAQISEPGAAHTIVKNNLGYKNQNSGATSVSDGGTISHGLNGTPTRVRATPSVAGQMVSVTALGSSTFTVAIKQPSGASGTTQTIYWEAEF